MNSQYDTTIIAGEGRRHSDGGGQDRNGRAVAVRRDLAGAGVCVCRGAGAGNRAGAAEDHVRQCAHRDGDRDGRQIPGHPHRSSPGRHHGRRSGRRRRQSADRSCAVDPRQEDRHHAGHGLRPGQEGRRHFRHRSVLRRVAAGRGDRELYRRRHQGVLDRRPHHAQRHLAGRRHAGQGGHHRQAVRAGHHQHRSGDAAAADHAGSALHRSVAGSRPRARRAMERVRQPVSGQCRQPGSGIATAGDGGERLVPAAGAGRRRCRRCQHPARGGDHVADRGGRRAVGCARRSAS